MGGNNWDLAETRDAETSKEVESHMMETAVLWLGRGAALTWFTGFILLGMVTMGGALMPLWLRAHRRRGWSYQLSERTGAP